MVLRWSSRLAALAAAVAGTGAARSAEAQQARELGIEAIATTARQTAVVAGPYLALRPSSRARISLSAGAGASEGALAWRGELLGHFLLSPAKRRGPGFYGAAGVAAVAGPAERGYIVLTVGLEEQPGARAGWVAEAGVGGGARLMLGYRRRWFSPH